ncbi:MAG: SPASM domain-containing protein [Planctomycetes bacterium]|nr:SPASM domain-containing protein [Planctomycetota bacterium]
MKIVAAVFADFAESFLGGAAQLRTRLGSRSVLGHTLTRVRRVVGLERCCLFVRSRDRDLADAVVGELGLTGEVDVLALDDGERPRRHLIRSARKWNLEAWRGSPLATTWFDEYVEPLGAARVLDHYQCEGVLCLDGHQPALDPDLASAMIAHQIEHDADAKMVFTQAPPGLAGIILCREVTRELLEQQLPVGILLSYRPEMVQGDPITRPVCYHSDALVSQTPARLTADTRRSRELLTAAFGELGEDVNATALCQWLRQRGHDRPGPLPVELELELTTDDPLPETTLRPRGDHVPRRQLHDLQHVARLAEELAQYDDRLVFIGGHGDPLLHPEFANVCQCLRTAGVCGVAAGTTLVSLPDVAFEALFEARVDLLEVRLDANSAETYRRVHGADHLKRVLDHIERIQAERHKRMAPQPIVVCSLTRCAATVAEVEAFFDGWIKATGWAVIAGYNEYCGLLPPDSLLAHTPPIREPCRRLGTRLTLLADGTVALCEQDVAGAQPAGDWFETPIMDIWGGKRLAEVRAAHERLELVDLPLCRRCGEWSRP